MNGSYRFGAGNIGQSHYQQPQQHQQQQAPNWVDTVRAQLNNSLHQFMASNTFTPESRQFALEFFNASWTTLYNTIDHHMRSGVQYDFNNIVAGELRKIEEACKVKIQTTFTTQAASGFGMFNQNNGQPMYARDYQQQQYQQQQHQQHGNYPQHVGLQEQPAYGTHPKSTTRTTDYTISNRADRGYTPMTEQELNNNVPKNIITNPFSSNATISYSTKDITTQIATIPTVTVKGCYKFTSDNKEYTYNVLKDTEVYNDLEELLAKYDSHFDFLSSRKRFQTFNVFILNEYLALKTDDILTDCADLARVMREITAVFKGKLKDATFPNGENPFTTNDFKIFHNPNIGKFGNLLNEHLAKLINKMLSIYTVKDDSTIDGILSITDIADYTDIMESLDLREFNQDAYFVKTINMIFRSALSDLFEDCGDKLLSPTEGFGHYLNCKLPIMDKKNLSIKIGKDGVIQGIDGLSITSSMKSIDSLLLKESKMYLHVPILEPIFDQVGDGIIFEDDTVLTQHVCRHTLLEYGQDLILAEGTHGKINRMFNVGCAMGGRLVVKPL